MYSAVHACWLHILKKKRNSFFWRNKFYDISLALMYQMTTFFRQEQLLVVTIQQNHMCNKCKNILEKYITLSFNYSVKHMMNFTLLTCVLESVQDFLIKLGIKPLMHLLEISTFSLNGVIVRLTKTMHRAPRNWAQFY